MFKCLLPFFLLIPAWSADIVPPPTPPECLTRPVTLGNVTLSCILLDVTRVNGSFDPGASPLTDAPVFQVRLSSTDPDVIAFRVGVTVVYPAVAVEGQAPASFTVWGSVGKSPSPFAPVTPAGPAPYLRYTFLLQSTAITGVEIQELKASSSQRF